MAEKPQVQWLTDTELDALTEEIKRQAPLALAMRNMDFDDGRISVGVIVLAKAVGELRALRQRKE